IRINPRMHALVKRGTPTPSTIRVLRRSLSLARFNVDRNLVAIAASHAASRIDHHDLEGCTGKGAW
ncbi:MAG: hypothetical protein VX813_00915, partial [Actinomycetota bacterium]|nr:hypothetical protein [Actinomycetota bacterium]